MRRMRRYNVHVQHETEKLGIQFNGLPPGLLTVKSVAAGSLGDVRGIEADDVLIQAGNEQLSSLEELTEDSFKSLLKGRPLHLVFQSKRERFIACADTTITKLGISFNGMPPGRLAVKHVSEDSFGAEHGVSEGDVLLRVGKDELVSLDDLSADGFKGFLKDRPLRLEFQSSATSDQTGTSQLEPKLKLPEHEQKALASEDAIKNEPQGRVFEIVADDSVGKLGISFNGMPPGRLAVKHVSEDSFGAEHGVSEGDVLLRVGKDELVSLDDLSADGFKGFLKDRPLRLEFQSSATSDQTGTSQLEPKLELPEHEQKALASEDAIKNEPQGRVFEIVADDSVGKLGISFNGMPPGHLAVKHVSEDSFGAEHGVSEGDVLLRVGKDELVSLDDLSADGFKGFLKDRPLRLEFQSSATSDQTGTSQLEPKLELPEHEQKALASEDAIKHEPQGRVFEIVADDSVGKLGISFNGMPPGRLAVKHVSEDSFGAEHGVSEGDVLLRVCKDELVSLDDLSADGFKGFLKDRPLRLEFQSSATSDQTGTSQLEPKLELPEHEQKALASEDAIKHEPQGRVFEIVADDSVGKLGISFNGMPPGRLAVKHVSEDSFGAEHGVSEGDVLLRVGKDELVSLDDLSADGFKGFLKDRPLRLEFQSSNAGDVSTEAKGQSKVVPTEATTPPAEASLMAEAAGKDTATTPEDMQSFAATKAGAEHTDATGQSEVVPTEATTPLAEASLMAEAAGKDTATTPEDMQSSAATKAGAEHTDATGQSEVVPTEPTSPAEASLMAEAARKDTETTPEDMQSSAATKAGAEHTDAISQSEVVPTEATTPPAEASLMAEAAGKDTGTTPEDVQGSAATQAGAEHTYAAGQSEVVPTEATTPPAEASLMAEAAGKDTATTPEDMQSFAATKAGAEHTDATGQSEVVPTEPEASLMAEAAGKDTGTKAEDVQSSAATKAGTEHTDATGQSEVVPTEATTPPAEASLMAEAAGKDTATTPEDMQSFAATKAGAEHTDATGQSEVVPTEATTPPAEASLMAEAAGKDTGTTPEDVQSFAATKAGAEHTDATGQSEVVPTDPISPAEASLMAEAAGKDTGTTPEDMQSSAASKAGAEHTDAAGQSEVVPTEATTPPAEASLMAEAAGKDTGTTPEDVQSSVATNAGAEHTDATGQSEVVPTEPMSPAEASLMAEAAGKDTATTPEDVQSSAATKAGIEHTDATGQSEVVPTEATTPPAEASLMAEAAGKDTATTPEDMQSSAATKAGAEHTDAAGQSEVVPTEATTPPAEASLMAEAAGKDTGTTPEDVQSSAATKAGAEHTDAAGQSEVVPTEATTRPAEASLMAEAAGKDTGTTPEDVQSSAATNAGAEHTDATGQSEVVPTEPTPPAEDNFLGYPLGQGLVEAG